MSALPAPPPTPCVSILIPTKDQPDLLRNCIDSIIDHTNYPLSQLEIIIINNQSKKESTKKYLRELSLYPRFKVLDYNSSFNFSAINNFAAQHANHEFLCLLNNDIEVISPNWLGEMLYHACRTDIACVGAKLYYPDNTIQHAGVVLGINGVAGHVYKHCSHGDNGYDNHLKSARYYSAVTAACMLVKASLYEEVGGFDEMLAVAYNDVDFCLKLGNLGYKHVWTPRAELYHHESISRGKHIQRTWLQQRRHKKEVRYMKAKWGNKLTNDPAWNSDWPLTESWCGKS